MCFARGRGLHLRALQNVVPIDIGFTVESYLGVGLHIILVEIILTLFHSLSFLLKYDYFGTNFNKSQ